MTAPAAVMGTGTVFCRPLRYLFDVERSIDVLANVTYPDQEPNALGSVHVHISISLHLPEHGSPSPASNEHDEPLEQLTDLVGRFVWLRVRLQLEPNTPCGASLVAARVQYQLCPATESFLLPVDHTNVFKVLVTDELISHLSLKTLQLNFIPPQLGHDEMSEDKSAQAKAADVPTPAPSSVPAVVPIGVARGPTSALKEDTEAARLALEAAAVAAHSAAEAAKEAAAAAKQAMDAVTTNGARESDRQRAESKGREMATEKLRELEAESKEKAFALEKQQYEHKLELLDEEKQRLGGDAARLARELEEKEAAMTSWSHQTASTDQAIELLKQRLAGDARERQELQRRLRILEEEKLELLKKSRACAVQ